MSGASRISCFSIPPGEEFQDKQDGEANPGDDEVLIQAHGNGGFEPIAKASDSHLRCPLRGAMRWFGRQSPPLQRESNPRLPQGWRDS